MSKKIQLLFSIVLFIIFAYIFIVRLNENKKELLQLSNELTSLIIPSIFSIMFFTTALAIRTWRWNVMLNLKKSFWVSYRSISIGYMVQTPLSKLGEVVRITNQITYTNKSKGEIISTVFVDRLLDFISLGTILFISLQLVGDKITTHFEDIAGLAPLLAGLVLAGIIGSVVFIFLRKKILNFIQTSSFIPPFAKERLVPFLENFIKGLACIKSPKILLFFLISSVLIWLCYLCSFYVIVTQFSFTKDLLSLSDITFTFMCSSLGAIIPVPGGLAYPLAIQKSFLFVLPSLSEAQAIGIGTITYFVVLWIANLVNGGASFLTQAILLNSKKND
jgi:glycosyltransferase 2 family protein